MLVRSDTYPATLSKHFRLTLSSPLDDDMLVQWNGKMYQAYRDENYSGYVYRFTPLPE